MTMITQFPGGYRPATTGVGARIAHDPGDPLITSHCPFCGSGQVIGRSDGTIACDFCGQNYIVRVQPAFPGVPQMPSGPGASSDVGPDGALMGPGEIGPDGLPVDGGPPPGDDEGAPPFGGDGGEEDEEAGFGGPDGGSAPPPPGAGDNEEQGKSSGSPPGKGKGKKAPPFAKKNSALFRGFDGQPLTEDQYVRHLAATLSAGHPAVMARLRADARRRPPFAAPRTPALRTRATTGAAGPPASGQAAAPTPTTRRSTRPTSGTSPRPGTRDTWTTRPAACAATP
jgi:hypothetical protein